MHTDVERTLNITIFQELLKYKNGFSCFQELLFFFYSLSLSLSGRVSLGLELCAVMRLIYFWVFFRVVPLVTLVMIAIFVPLASFCCHSLVQ